MVYVCVCVHLTHAQTPTRADISLLDSCRNVHGSEVEDRGPAGLHCRSNA